MFAFFESKMAPPRDYPIVLDNPLFYRSYSQNYPAKYILYVPEQLSRPNVLQNVVDFIESASTNIVKIWTYSVKNTEILQRFGIESKTVPLTSPWPYLNKLLAYRTMNDPIYDVGFCGSQSPRRMQILQALIDGGLTVNNVTQFGDDRDFELSKCRVMINVHFADDYCIFESARCEPWLAIGVPVISEQSWDDDPRAINVPYDQLVEKTIEVVKSLRG
jgi:hypothetical protein